jgi:hypothetical protein
MRFKVTIDTAQQHIAPVCNGRIGTTKRLAKSLISMSSAHELTHDANKCFMLLGVQQWDKIKLKFRDDPVKHIYFAFSELSHTKLKKILSTYLTHFIDFNITAEWHFTVTWEVNL